MFRILVILVHALIFILVTMIGLAGKYNPAPPESEANYSVWFLIFVIFNIYHKLTYSACFNYAIHISLCLSTYFRKKHICDFEVQY